MSTMEDSNAKTVFDFYFRGNYFFFIPIILSVLLKKTDYILFLWNCIKSQSLNSSILTLNLLALYFILFKLKFRFKFTISYN